jgi:hypothetical protein
MQYTNDNKINKLFEECGIMMIGDNGDYNFLLPEKKDLISAFNSESEFENFTEEYKLDIILSFLSKKNHFRIIDWKFFFANPNIFTVNEKMMLGSILTSFKIHYGKNELRFTSNRGSNNFVKELAKNKEFIKFIFSKDTQLKAIFLPSEQVERNIKKELVRLIGKKITELGVYEKINELPKLILKDLK